MTCQRLSKDAIFNAAAEMDDAAEREAFLRDVCAHDPRLREEIEDLLERDLAVGRFLESAPPGIGATIEAPSASDLIGTSIGPYKLLQEIGEGGFGVVYMAEQSKPVNRKVALKIVKPGMDTREVIGRFEAERQALAMMDHPNIARILDAGTVGQALQPADPPQADGDLQGRQAGKPAPQTGRPYFVMELVKGVPITHYGDKNNLSTHERLELFVTVCRAVQHAHQKGVIHRDIKPSNVMVTLHDGQPVVKVIDFGVAKALNQKLTEKTLFTAYGQMIGTPQYMSPEQAEMSGLDVDTRSDIYSLGVLLYELLTGTTPLESKRLREAGFAEMQRMIQEEEPPRPSTRLSTLGDELTVVAKHRSTDPNQLRKAIHGELDWIVMKSLEKERGRRYESASSFAADVQRYLSNEAVEACPPSRGYRIRKLVGRHRGVVSAVGAVMASLVVGLAVATYAFLRARDESVRSGRVVQVLNEMLESADPSIGKGKGYTVRAMLDDFAATLDGRFDDDPVVEAQLRHTIGRAYFHLGLPDASEPHLRRALELCRQHPSGRLDEALILTDLARTLLNGAGSLPESEVLVRKAIEIYRRRDKVSPELANSFCILGWILVNKTWGLQLSRSENEGERLNREGVELLKDFTDTRSLTVKGKMLTALGFEGLRSSDPTVLLEANGFAERGLELLRTHAPHDHFVGLALKAGGQCKMKLGRPEEAEAALREAFEFDRSATGAVHHETLHALMSAMFQEGKYDEALDLARASFAWDRAEAMPTNIKNQVVLTDHVLGLGDLIAAEALARTALQNCETQFGSDHGYTRLAQSLLWQTLVGQNDGAKQAEAQRLLASILPYARENVDGKNLRERLGYMFIVAHRSSPERADLDHAVALNRHVLAQRTWPIYRLRNLYAGVLLRKHQGDREQATAFLREIIASPVAYDWSIWEGRSPFYILRSAEDHVAGMLLESGSIAAAKSVYFDAVGKREEAERPDKYQIAFAKARLGRFLIEQGEREEAHERLVEAQTDLANAPACFQWLKDRVDEDARGLGETHGSRN